jgi:hypothetical protein
MITVISQHKAPALLPPHLNPSITIRKIIIGAAERSQLSKVISIMSRDYTLTKKYFQKT